MKFLKNKVVMITGGTGSFGQICTELLLQHKVKKVIIYSRDELKQFEMQQEFSAPTYPSIRYFIGDVRDANRLEMAVRGIDYVVHAAALKQVPAAEYNPFEFIHTNVPNTNYCISKKKPISRAFFKMIEICNIFDIFEEKEKI